MTKWVLPLVLAAALVFTGVWGYNQYTMNRQYAIHMENIYQKSFYELVGNVGNVETRMAKLMVSGDQGQNMMLLSEVCRQAEAALADLGQLPISHLALMRTSKYLNQLSDYAYYLSKKVSGGSTLSVEEMDNLRELHANAARLSTELHELEVSLQQGGVRWGELAERGREQFHEISDDLATQRFIQIERTGIEYPSLIYDGPFSEALQDRERAELTGTLITQKEAEEIAAEFIGRDRIARVGNASQSRGDMETWGVFIETDGPGGPIYLAVTKKGGRVLNMVAEHAPQEKKLTMEQVQEKAEVFLDSRGFPDMVPTYLQHYDGTAVINFAYQEKGIVMYPDLIKVKISLEDGTVLGFEARNYLIAHRRRNLEAPKLSKLEARALVSPSLVIESEGMAVIPTPSKQERFCYEFKGTYGEHHFIVYIDANTGEEADILQILHTENGTLAM